MLRISVIIPNYNHAVFLKQRIESVINQTYQNLDILILDDFSTDNSKDIIESYRNHPKVSQIIYNDTNSGNTFLQWKKGIELAKGDWVWIAESDDWCEVTLLEELVQGALENPSCTLSYCQSSMTRGNDILWTSTTRRLKENVEGKRFVLTHMLKGNSIFNASMAIFKKIEYFEINHHFLNYKYCGDWLFWIEIASKGYVHISGKTLNYFRKHSNDVTSVAVTSGLGYSEYLKMIKLLSHTHIDVHNRRTALYIARHKKLLLDKKVESSIKTKLKSDFKKLLGFKYYFAILWFYLFITKKGVNSFLAFKNSPDI